MNNDIIKDIEEIKTPCKTPLELFKSDEFLRWIKIILEKINFDNTDYVLSIFTKAINKEQLNTIEESIIFSILENKDFEKYWNQLLKRLPKSKITANFENIENLNYFNSLFEEITWYNWFELIADTLKISIKNKAASLLEFEKIENFSELWEEAKNIIKKYFPEDYNENKLYEKPIFNTIMNFIKYNKNYNKVIETLKDDKNKLRKRLNLFYNDKWFLKYNINANTFKYLSDFLDDGIFSEEEIDNTLSYNTYYFNNLEEINEYQVAFVIKLKEKNINEKELFKYIELIKTKNDLSFFNLIINKFIYDNNLIDIVEKYIYKQLPDYMLQSRWEEPCYYEQLLEEKWTRWNYHEMQDEFHRLETAKLIIKIWMKNYIKLYEYNKEKLEKYLYTDIDEIEKGIWKLEKLISK